MPVGRDRNYLVVVGRADSTDRVGAFFKILRKLKHRSMSEIHSQFLEHGKVMPDD